MDKEKLEIIGAIAFNELFGQQPRIAKSIVSSLGSTSALFGLSEKEIKQLFKEENKQFQELWPGCMDRAAESHEKLSCIGCKFLYLGHKDYPDLLAECPDAPVLLYVLSNSHLDRIFKLRPAISVVGTRDSSPYGEEWCSKLIAALARAEKPPVIVSGLAIGVDVCAHLAALSSSLPTIAVSPVGIDDIYPKRHALIAERIASTPDCAIITDYPPGTIPQPHVFLRRNRIIAGISQSTILIESKFRGGGMMTSRLAFGYGRNVFSLPGRIDDVNSGGCNALIADKIAEPIISVKKLASQLGLGEFSSPLKKAEEAIKEKFSKSMDERQIKLLTSIYELVRKKKGINFDEICSELNLEYSEFAKLSGLLENAGFIRSDLLQRCTTSPGFA